MNPPAPPTPPTPPPTVASPPADSPLPGTPPSGVPEASQPPPDTPTPGPPLPAATTWQRVSPWVWEPLHALFLYFCFLFFLDHSLGPDTLGKVVAGGALLLAVGLSRLIGPAPARLQGVRRLATRVVVLFLVASAVLGPLEIFTSVRSLSVQSALQKVFDDYGLYPASLAELGEVSDLDVPPTAMGLRHPRPFHYERFGENGEHYVLFFDAALFRVCSLTDVAGDDVTPWKCARKARPVTTPQG